MLAEPATLGERVAAVAVVISLRLLVYSPDGARLLTANQSGGHLYDTASWKVTRLEASYTRPR